ncbi:hypothetical protein J4S57_003392 [Salmonella enterica]|nr:hypothetical protein [Salmonella enterica]EIB7674810.1 hypothetical protein [Salmonella enterica]
MKKIIAIAALASTLTAGAFAATPASSSAEMSNPVSTGTSFIYDSQEPSVALVFDTTILPINPSAAQTGDALAKTHFKTAGASTTYHVEASFAGANTGTQLEAAFSSNGTTADRGNVYLTNATANEDANILLLKKAALNAGTTTVTYTVTGYTA